MLDAAEAAERLLIGSRMEQADVLRIALFQFGQENGVRVALRIVEIFAVAGQSAEEDPLIFLIPIVDGQHDVALVDAPCVGQCGDERRVDHVPVLAIVLLLLVDDGVERCAAFAHGERTELCKDIGFFNTVDRCF